MKRNINLFMMVIALALASTLQASGSSQASKKMSPTIKKMSPSNLVKKMRGDPNQMSPVFNQAVATPVSLSQKEPLVQVALLLDTSGSMKGLIDQARYQLWNVVSELSQAKRNGKPIKLQIAVYQYGMDRKLSPTFMRQVTPFTDDLDRVSAGLFSLTLDGGDEYCGKVIDAAMTDLAWSDDPSVYKAIFIAGNESFDQGKITFGELLPEAKARSITINTIFCAGYSGNKEDRFDIKQWRVAAELAGGVPAEINHNHKLPQMKTPYDQKMRELNQKMNKTFVWYGTGASKAKANQKMQDANAEKMSNHAFAARMSAKIGHLYHHKHHDLVDAIRHGQVDISKMPAEKMPPLLQSMTPDERLAFVDKKTSERQSVRRQMADVIVKRHRYLENRMMEKLGGQATGPYMLGEALSKAIRKQAAEKGYQFGDQFVAVP